MAGTTELRWGNGISGAGAAVVLTTLSIQSSLSLELTSLKTTINNSYTSLRDILPSPPVNSPSSSAAAAIRNRLVKQAAWAYLQPMSASPTSHGPTFLRRHWLRLSAAAAGDDGGLDSSCLGFLACHVIRAVDRLLALFQLHAGFR